MSSVGKWLNIEVPYLYKGMLLSLEKERHSDKWHNLYEPGGFCAKKNQPVKRKETVVSFTLGACKSQAGRKTAEEMLGEGQVIQHAERSSLQLMTMAVAQLYECTPFAVTQQLLENSHPMYFIAVLKMANGSFSMN